MTSADDFVDLLTNPEFKLLVAQLVALVRASTEDTTTPNIVCDALQYVSLLIHEAKPEHCGPAGLTEAYSKISADTIAMLNLIRDASVRQGKPILWTMFQKPTLN